MTRNGAAVRVCVVGCGRWGPNHIRNFGSLPGCRVVSCVELDQARRERVGQLFPGIKVHAKLDEGLQGCDAVVISTPTSTHHALVKLALSKGKHALCEKPLCENARQARELAALAERKGLVLMTGHVFLFNGGVLKLKEIIGAGELGELRYLSAVRTNLGPIRSDVNAAYDLAAHDVSVFNWLLDAKPKAVSATGASFLRSGIEDVSFIALTYPGGVYANIHSSWLNPKKVRQTIVVGSRKMVAWDDMELSTPVAIYDKGAGFDKPATEYGEFLRLSMWDGEVRLPKVDLEEPLKAQDRAFVEAVRSGALERSGPEFSAGVVETLEAAAKSMKQGGRPVKLS